MNTYLIKVFIPDSDKTDGRRRIIRDSLMKAAFEFGPAHKIDSSSVMTKSAMSAEEIKDRLKIYLTDDFDFVMILQINIKEAQCVGFSFDEDGMSYVVETANRDFVDPHLLKNPRH